MTAEKPARRASRRPAVQRRPLPGLGELALIYRAPRAMTITAVAPTTVLVIDQPTFTRALARWPEFGGALLRTLAARA